jgi:AraC-like DNA-binding protein
MEENRYVEDIQYEVKKKLHIFHDKSPISFAYVNSYTDVDQHTFHVHQGLEVYFCMSEHVDYIVGDDYYELKPGDVVRIKPNDIHKVVIRKPHQYARFFICFPADSLPDHLLAPLSALLRCAEGKSVRMRLPEDEWQSIHRMLCEALGICRDSSAARNTALVQTHVYALCLQILCALCEHADAIRPAERRTGGAELSRLLSDVYIYMDQHIKEIQNVADIAEAIHVSPSYLSALFRKHLGVPLVYQLQSLKMSLAKQMLEEGYTVVDACRALGFTDCSYFIRVFKRHLGVTPLQYRNAFFSTESASGGEGAPRC